MLEVHKVKGVYLACGTTDLRKSINGLSLIVQEKFELDPFSTNLFVFCNRNRDILKILQWDHNGFWIYYRRLEKGKFKWPDGTETTSQINLKELKWLLDGWAINRGKAHEKMMVNVV